MVDGGRALEAKVAYGFVFVSAPNGEDGAGFFVSSRETGFERSNGEIYHG